MKEIKIYNTLEVNVQSESNEYTENPMVYAAEIIASVNKDDVDLAEYADDYHGSTYYKKLHSIRMGVDVYDGQMYGVATCTVADDWTDSDTEQLKDYLTGQYSDGWGEGFEQREIATFTELETFEEYDEENDEYYESEWDARYCVYVSFWQCEGFRIMTEKELKDSP